MARSARMSSMEDPSHIVVPGQRTELVPPAADRVRALKRHLIEAIRDLQGARRAERLIQRRTPEPAGFPGRVVAAACGLCQGSCCMAGGTHAFIDDRTMARLRAERPSITGRQAVRLYVESVAPLSYRNSCLFHGPRGCTLNRTLRAELCNSYYCNDLDTFLKASVAKDVTIVTTAGETRVVEIARTGDG